MIERAKTVGVLRGVGLARLSADQIRDIRKSNDKVIVIGLEYGISISVVSDIRNRKLYRWVK